MEKKAMNNDYEGAITLFNEDGTPKSKEEFMKEVGDFYDNAAAPNSCNHSTLDFLCNPETLIDPPVVLNNFDFYTRTIYIDSEITPELGTEIVRKIRMWNYIDDSDCVDIEERIPIKVYIDTPGGDVNAVFSIISAIQISETPVHTITYGCGYSGGFFIGICGHRKFGFPHSSYLFHEGMTLDGGDAHKFLQHVDFYKIQLKKIKDITISNTKISSDDYEAKRKDDWFFSAAEALHYGIIDEVVESF